MRFCLLTVVWGSEFTDRFIRITLRSLLAAGNLAELAAAHPVIYDIHTTATDAERLRTHRVFLQVSQLVEVRLHIFSVAQIDPKNPSSHWTLWHRGAAQLTAEDDVLVTVAADHLFSSGTLLHWADLFLRGNVAMFGSGVQVVAETLEDEIDRTFPTGLTIDLSVDALHELMFRHLHPVKISMLRGAPRWIEHPEEHLRPLQGRGMSQNVLTSHAVAFRPRAVRMNEHFCPVEKLDRVVFEPCRYLSLEPALKHVSLYLHPWQMTENRLSNFGGWGASFIFPVNKRESRVTHFYRVPGAVAPIDRRRTELSAGLFVRQIHTSQRIFEVWRHLHDQGSQSTARWLATAQMYARLRRRVPVRLPATVFVPAERVLSRLTKNQKAELLAHGGRQLIAAIRAHIAMGHYQLARGDWLVASPTGSITTCDGLCYSAAEEGIARIVSGPVHLDGIEIYTIDRPLTPIELSPASASDSMRALGRMLRNRAQRATTGARAALVHRLQRRPFLYRLAQRVVRAMRRGGGATITQSPAQETSPALDAYRRGLGWRIVDAMRDLYSFYRAEVLAGSSVTSAPAERLDQATADTSHARGELDEAVRLNPYFAEAWLELGFARLTAGDQAGALDAFAKASTLPPILAQPHWEADPRDVAAVERVRLLAEGIDTAAALKLLEEAPQRWPVPWKYHDLKSGLLLRAGRIDEALEAFDLGMRRDNIKESFAGLLPRNLAALESTVADTGKTRTLAE